MRCTWSDSCVVTGNDLTEQSGILCVDHEARECMLMVMDKNTLGVSQCGVSLIGVDKFLHLDHLCLNTPKAVWSDCKPKTIVCVKLFNI